jgi:hypothetical protein
MKYTPMTGLSILLISALIVPGATATTRVEAQLHRTHHQLATDAPTQPVPKDTHQPKSTWTNPQARRTDSDTPNKLSERDRIIREYQTQTVIPAQ